MEYIKRNVGHACHSGIKQPSSAELPELPERTRETKINGHQTAATGNSSLEAQWLCLLPAIEGFKDVTQNDELDELAND